MAKITYASVGGGVHCNYELPPQHTVCTKAVLPQDKLL